MPPFVWQTYDCLSPVAARISEQPTGALSGTLPVRHFRHRSGGRVTDRTNASLVKPRVLMQNLGDLSSWVARHSVPRRRSGGSRAGLPKGQGLWGALAISTDARGCVGSC